MHNPDPARRQSAAESAAAILETIHHRDGPDAAHQHALGMLSGAAIWLANRSDPLFAATALSAASARVAEHQKEIRNGEE